MNSYDPAAPVAMHRLAKALVDISGTITSLAMEMAEYGQNHEIPPEAPPLHDALIGLLQFDYLIQRYGPSRVKKAAQVIEQVHELMLSDIFVLADDFAGELEDESPPEP